LIFIIFILILGLKVVNELGPEAEGVEELSLGFQPISADLMRGALMGEWFLSRRDSTIVARHEVPG
jgi:hypothetical protein